MAPQKRTARGAGYCIHCGHSITRYDTEYPFCIDCWVDHDMMLCTRDREALRATQGRYCHACGGRRPDISYARPCCGACPEPVLAAA